MSGRLYRVLRVVLTPIYAALRPARVEGAENVPDEGGFILCSNHVSARDPIYLALRLKKRQLHFMAKAELFKIKPLGALIRALGAFPVDRHNSDLNAIRTALKLLNDGHGLAIFPQGTRSRDNSPTPMLNGVSMIALRAGKPAIPAYIGGPYRLFRRTAVRFGKPVDLSEFGRRMDSETLTAATQKIADSIWAMKD